jgi:hypothetical protein
VAVGADEQSGERPRARKSEEQRPSDEEDPPEPMEEAAEEESDYESEDSARKTGEQMLAERKP